MPAWQYIIARVQQEFPETIFLLEGLGGAWEVTDNLLTDGGMQWAYSELFQNYSGRRGAAVSRSQLHSRAQRIGAATSITAKRTTTSASPQRGRAWSLLRNRLCALTSSSGGYRFHLRRRMARAGKNQRPSAAPAWPGAAPENIVPELAQLNRLISDHPCFFDGAKLTRLSAPDSPVYALRRESAEGKDSVLVLVNTDVEQSADHCARRRTVRNLKLRRIAI